MAHWGAPLMLILTGIGICGMWMWLWLGITARTRAFTFERFYPWSPSASIRRIQAFIWPAFLILGFTWIAAGDLVARSFMGRSYEVTAGLIAFLFVLQCALVIGVAHGMCLPRWCYPGWRAERYYLRRPSRAAIELGARSAYRFTSVRAA